jgi:uncharacterized protein YjiK
MSYKLGSDTNENVGFEGLATDHAAGHPTASDPTRLLSKTDTSWTISSRDPSKLGVMNGRQQQLSTKILTLGAII